MTLEPIFPRIFLNYAMGILSLVHSYGCITTYVGLMIHRKHYHDLIFNNRENNTYEVMLNIWVWYQSMFNQENWITSESVLNARPKTDKLFPLKYSMMWFIIIGSSIYMDLNHFLLAHDSITPMKQWYIWYNDTSIGTWPDQMATALTDAEVRLSLSNIVSSKH